MEEYDGVKQKEMGKLRFRLKKGGTQMPPPPSKAAAVKKKAGGSRLWMRMDRWGNSELIECDKSVIIQRVSIPARDLRILGPIFSHSYTILAREKAIIVNLEFTRAIVTAEEVLILDPLSQEVLPFVDQLRGQLLQRESPSTGQDELPFEFQVLEIALQVVCRYLDSSVAQLERDAYPALDELAINVSTKNLEYVRTLKTNLTRLLARVQKVRDEIEHLLDEDEDMAQMYLTRKWIQAEAQYAASAGSNSIVPASTHLRRISSNRCHSFASNYYLNGRNVDELEMLLEAYFMQLDVTRNKILSVREYIEDTEEYVNIQLDNQRNELIQLQMVITIALFSIEVENLAAALLGLNIRSTLYEMDGIFGQATAIITAISVALFAALWGYARWQKLIGS